jgi:hypothetical protein
MTTQYYKMGRKDMGRQSLKTVVSMVTAISTPNLTNTQNVFSQQHLCVNISEITIAAFTLTKVVLI